MTSLASRAIAGVVLGLLAAGALTLLVLCADAWDVEVVR